MYYTIKQKFCKQTVESSTDFVPFFKDTCYLALSTILTRIVKLKTAPLLLFLLLIELESYRKINGPTFWCLTFQRPEKSTILSDFVFV